jgi:hypothetical protein
LANKIPLTSLTGPSGQWPDEGETLNAVTFEPFWAVLALEGGLLLPALLTRMSTGFPPKTHGRRLVLVVCAN